MISLKTPRYTLLRDTPSPLEQLYFSDVAKKKRNTKISSRVPIDTPFYSTSFAVTPKVTECNVRTLQGPVFLPLPPPPLPPPPQFAIAPNPLAARVKFAGPVFPPASRQPSSVTVQPARVTLIKPDEVKPRKKRPTCGRQPSDPSPFPRTRVGCTGC